jgi:hypothetical protein
VQRALGQPTLYLRDAVADLGVQIAQLGDERLHDQREAAEDHDQT